MADLEVQLHVAKIGDSRYHVSLTSAAGEATGLMELDPWPLLDSRAAVENSVLASAVAARRVAPEEEPLSALGRQLFDALFASPAVLGQYRAGAALADDRADSLRVALRLDAPELAVLPWEALYDPELAGFVARRSLIVRRIPVQKVVRPLRVRPPLRVLAVAASPRGLAPLDVESERRRLEEALAEPTARGLVSVEWVHSATWHELQDKMLSGVWHLLHFVGHGDYDAERDEGVLALTGDDGRANLVPAESFLDLLSEATPTPRLVVLNSCAGATGGAEDLFTGTAATLVRGGIPAVAAMQFSISDRAALTFCRGFYTALSYGHGVDAALRSGRRAIAGVFPRSLEWITPVLYLRGSQTQLFELLEDEQAPGDEPPSGRELPAPVGPAALGRGGPAHEEPAPAWAAAFVDGDGAGDAPAAIPGPEVDRFVHVQTVEEIRQLSMGRTVLVCTYSVENWLWSIKSAIKSFEKDVLHDLLPVARAHGVTIAWCNTAELRRKSSPWKDDFRANCFYLVRDRQTIASAHFGFWALGDGPAQVAKAKELMAGAAG